VAQRQHTRKQIEARKRNLTRAGQGRPPGVPNKVTTEAKAACNALVDDPVYRQNLQLRLRKGTLPPAMETMLWYYAKGKPKERVEFGADKTLADLVLEAVGRKPGEPPLRPDERRKLPDLDHPRRVGDPVNP
jgi:hypothetical protein